MSNVKGIILGAVIIVSGLVVAIALLTTESGADGSGISASDITDVHAPATDDVTDSEVVSDAVSTSTVIIADDVDEARREKLTRALPKIDAKTRKLKKTGPKRFDEPQAAMDYYLKKRLPPGQNLLPLEKLRTELQAITAVQSQLAATRGGVSAAGQWTELGPGNIGGRTRAIAIDPSNTDVIYAAGVAGGIWKSTDRGASWNVADDMMLNLAVTTIVIDPDNTDVLYAGTGEGVFNSDAVRGLGIFKSTDAGATWNQLPGTVEPAVPFGAFFRVNDLVISPADSNRVYAATRWGVWRSSDGGATWTNVLANPFQTGGAPASNGSFAGCLELAIRTDTGVDPDNDVVFAAFGSFTADGLFRTTDGGASWSQLGTAADLNVFNQGRMALAIAPSDNDVIYVSMADNGGGNSTGTMVNVLRSVDGGDTWTNQLSFADFEIFLLSNVPFGNGCFGASFFSQGWYDNVIAVDPTDSDTVWLGGVDLFRSSDGGQNFELASYWYFATDDPNYAHADQHAIVFDPNYDGLSNQTVFVGNDGGVFISTNAAAMASTNSCPFVAGGPLPTLSWDNLNNGYGVTQFYHGDVSQFSDIFAGGAQDNGTMRVATTTTPDAWSSIFGGDGGYYAINHDFPWIMYAETQFFPNMIRSFDGGASFFDATNGVTDSDGLFITPFEMDPTDPDNLWSGGTRPWRTTDGAANWTLANVDTNSFSARISAIAVAPTDGNVVYMGLQNGVVAVTTNGLSVSPAPSWIQIGGAGGLPSGFISDVAVSHFDAGVAFVTYSTFFGGGPHVFKTVNGGQTWISIDAGSIAAGGVPEIPVHSVVVRPCDDDQLFVGTELGVFASTDGGASWTPFSNGLPNTVVEELALQYDGDVLVAFTHGRGAFRAPLASCDCNTNMIPDAAEISAGTGSDCDNNGRLDDCELDSRFVDQSPQLSPIGDGNPQAYSILSAPPAASDVILRVELLGDFNDPLEFLDVDLNGSNIVRLLDADPSTDCPSVAAVFDIVLDAGTYNALLGVGGGDANFDLTATADVNPTLCASPTFVRLTVSYNVAAGNDCDVDQIPDKCESDCNTNGAPDDCEGLPDCNSNGTPDECETLSDCNTNGTPDECEGFAECNGNGVPDDCETPAGGDFDLDGDVDLDDAAALVDCLAGPLALPAPTDGSCVQFCLDAFDHDFDADVDLADAAEFTLDFTGP